MEGDATRPRAREAGRRAGSRPGFEPLLPDLDTSSLGAPASSPRKGQSLGAGHLVSAYPVAAVTASAPCPCWRQRHCPSVPDPTLALSSALCHSDHMSQTLATWRLGWFGQQEALPSQGREKPGDYSPRPHLCVSCGIPNRTVSGLWVAPSQVGPPHPPPEGGSSFLP